MFTGLKVDHDQRAVVDLGDEVERARVAVVRAIHHTFDRDRFEVRRFRPILEAHHRHRCAVADHRRVADGLAKRAAILPLDQRVRFAADLLR